MDGDLRKLFREHLPEVDWTSVESGGTGSGIPDANGCCRGVEFWVECKLTRAWSVKMLPAQCGWILRRIRHGGRVHIAVRRKVPEGPRRHAADELWLVRGKFVRELKTSGLRNFPTQGLLCPVQRGGPSHWDWSAALRALVS